MMDHYTQLFKALNKNKIEWCSWKSNEHLLAGLNADTDMDLLFDANSQTKVIQIFQECGFVIFYAPESLKYPGVIDAIAFDSETGKILHAHSHFLLCAGEKYLKSTVLPWEDKILAKRQKSDIAPDVYISAPEDELILLLTRQALKIRARDKYGLTRNAIWNEAHYKDELRWLKAQTSSDQVHKRALELLDQESAAIIQEIYNASPNFERVLKLQHAVKKHEWKRMDRLNSILQVWYREGLYIVNRLAEKAGFPLQRFTQKRTLPYEGYVIAMLGADGSGKSTVAKTLHRELRKKIDVRYIYLGTGDGPKTIILHLLDLIFYTRKKLRRSTPSSSVKQASSEQSNTHGISTSTILTAIAGILNKKIMMRRIQKYHKKGFIVICDRWPQNKIAGYNDGPLLVFLKTHHKKFLRKLALWEEKQLQIIETKYSPDLILRLNVSAPVSLSRKPENAALGSLLQKKIEGLKTLNFSSELIDINADQSLNEVLKNVRQKIWSNVQHLPVLSSHIYECAGMPGSGKTTLCNKIIQETQFHSVQDMYTQPLSRIQKINLVIKSFIKNPLLYIETLKIIVLYKIWKNKEALDLFWRLPVQKLQLQTKATAPQIYLLEQLLLQNIWSAFFRADVKNVKSRHLSPYITRLYKDLHPIILYFDAGMEAAAERVAMRKNGSSPFDGRKHAEIITQINTFTPLMKDIIQAAEYAGLDVTHINSSKDTQAVYQQVKETIDSALKIWSSDFITPIDTKKHAG